jgi:hypothetical protein
MDKALSAQAEAEMQTLHRNIHGNVSGNKKRDIISGITHNKLCILYSHACTDKFFLISKANPKVPDRVGFDLETQTFVIPYVSRIRHHVDNTRNMQPSCLRHQMGHICWTTKAPVEGQPANSVLDDGVKVRRRSAQKFLRQG